MKEILSLNHNGSELCLFRIDGKLKFVKKENNKLKTTLTREERVLLLNVVANLMPSNDITRLHDIKMDGKQMKHFFDKKRGWHLFYELNDSGFTLPTKDEQIRLNNMFNRQVTSIYSANNPKKDDKIKRIIRFGKTIAVVFVASAISFVANGCSK